jgi:hypothetical protein
VIDESIPSEPRFSRKFKTPHWKSISDSPSFARDLYRDFEKYEQMLEICDFVHEGLFIGQKERKLLCSLFSSLCQGIRREVPSFQNIAIIVAMDYHDRPPLDCFTQR